MDVYGRVYILTHTCLPIRVRTTSSRVGQTVLRSKGGIRPPGVSLLLEALPFVFPQGIFKKVLFHSMCVFKGSESPGLYLELEIERAPYLFVKVVAGKGKRHPTL